MSNLFERKNRILKRKYQEKEDLRKIAQLPAYRRIMIAAIGISICALILTIFVAFYDDFTRSTFLILRGIIGVCALITIILAAIYYYLVFNTYWKNRSK